MTAAQKATSTILRQILDEYGTGINLTASSKLLTSDANVARALASATEDIRTPFGPIITIAVRDSQQAESVAKVIDDIPHASKTDVKDLAMDFFTHAVFGVEGEDPKIVYEGLKYVIFSLQPKGVGIVVALRQETGQTEEGFSVDLDDKIKYQSRGRLEDLQDVVRFVGFETGKIRRLDRSVDVDGKTVQAQVMLTRKWDQLTG